MDQILPNKHKIRRQQLWAILHHGRGRAGKVFNFFLIILILLSIALVPLGFIPSYREYDIAIHTIEAIIVAFFTVEYALRIYAAPRRLRYIFSFFGIIDLLSIVPFYAGVFGTEYIRIAQLVRMLKLAEIDAASQQEEAATMQKDIGLVEGERVEYIVTKSSIVLFFGVIPPIIAIAFGLGLLMTFGGFVTIAIALTLFLFALIFLWKAWLDYSYDVIYVTNFRLIFQNQHILGRSVNQVNYNAITNVKPFYPNPFSYIARYGSLIIDTAAEHPGQIGLHTVRRHEEAAHCIMQKTLTMQQRTGGPGFSG